jgi:hypothetical protein
MFVAKPHILVQQLDISSIHNVQDIMTFLQTQMTEIQLTNTLLPLPPDLPGLVHLCILASCATTGIFMWALTTCHFIDSHDLQKHLDLLL